LAFLFFFGFLQATLFGYIDSMPILSTRARCSLMIREIGAGHGFEFDSRD